MTSLFKGTLSWRTVLPAMAAYNVARVFIEARLAGDHGRRDYRYSCAMT
ncbi:MAG: hypothetical protein MI924_04065 [Chloroflexales bacterium]|nr:hypothetical protein [Chloroflexales bacterium]